MEELWKPLPDYEDHYAVSNYGQIKRTKQARGTRSGKVLKPHKMANGYMAVTVSVNCEERIVYVHRAVARAFLEPEDGKYYVNHKDGDKSNNHAGNLEWVTAQENCIHSLYTLSNIDSYGALTEAQVLAIRDDNRTQAAIAAEYGISQMLVCRIKRGEMYMRYGGKIINAKRAVPHRLTDEEVLEIRASDKSGVVLARQYGVASSTISRIRNGQRRNTFKEIEHD